jgi:exonuclease SbcC
VPGFDFAIFAKNTIKIQGNAGTDAWTLALGLADVVQAYEGGMKLDTVFVDEGFGSLDPDNLAAALATLMGLQTGGRLVGIISHVGELRDQIDARLEVSSSRAGSTAAFCVP